MLGGRTSHSVLPSPQEMGTCTAPTQMFFIDTGSWDITATSHSQALEIAAEIVDDYSAANHPWGTINPEALVSFVPHHEEQEEYVPPQGTYK